MTNTGKFKNAGQLITVIVNLNRASSQCDFIGIFFLHF